ncbi:AI-2E family transporter [Paraferrimonas sedimenticola]|uniref:Membrane protein n=1 Tax=Paraferrimonas sedimenticola TaxID=375674 RepID=A0AA37RSD8_9GAMM|nr:AI-2E family transporter [Paraferrimonas sedimenticola]GLP94819.1 membrane protein [Paraferrimonas sedimenticola]
MLKVAKESVMFRSLAIMAFLVVIMAGIKAASAVLVPFILSAFIAIICYPLIRRMTDKGVPKVLAVLVIVAFIVLMGLWLAGLVGSSINEFTQQLPVYRAKLLAQLGWVFEWLAHNNVSLGREQILAYFDPGKAMSLATNMLSGVGGVMTNLFLIILTVVFMLFEAPSLGKKVHLAMDDPTMRIKQIDEVLESINRYMVIKTLISLATGAVVGLGLTLIGVDYALLWAVVAFLFNYIPNIGSIIAAVPAVILALVQLGPAAAGATALLYLGTNTVMGNAIEPRFMGKGLGLSTLVVFLSLLFWGWLLGSTGMLLSVPLTMVVKIAMESSSSGRWLSVIMGGDADLDKQIEQAEAEQQAQNES